MHRERLHKLLERVRSGEVGPDAALEELRKLPFEDVDGMARVDHHRALRLGVPEVVFGESKTAEQIVRIMGSLAAGGAGAFATRVSPDKAQEVVAAVDGARYHEVARVVVVDGERPVPARARGEIAVVSAGTSDAPVAEEAAATIEFLGHRVRRVVDVGVAGLQRVIAAAEELRTAEVAVVVAGMEGALPAVVSSLIDRPIIAVPTSVGYGVGIGGYVAMMSMLASCSPGVSVVNIDNGFGAAVAAVRINTVRDYE